MTNFLIILTSIWLSYLISKPTLFHKKREHRSVAPYKIIVKSKIDTDIKNFFIISPILWDLNNFKEGNFISDDFEYDIFCETPNLTLLDLIKKFETSPFRVGLLYVQSSTPSNILQTFSVDNNNGTDIKQLIPTIDPYQQQSSVIATKTDFIIDKKTSLQASILKANSTMNIYLFPIDPSAVKKDLRYYLTKLKNIFNNQK
jgi:hypothetical protein